MKKYFLMISLLFLNSLIQASSFSDVSSKDPNYLDFQYATKNGYFSIYDDGTIKPNSYITRREASIIIKKFQDQLNSTRLSLSSSEIKELNLLAKSYKSIYTANENTIKQLQSENADLNSSNELLKKDMTLLNASMAEMKKERRLIFILIGTATLAGTLL